MSPLELHPFSWAGRPISGARKYVWFNTDSSAEHTPRLVVLLPELCLYGYRSFDAFTNLFQVAFAGTTALEARIDIPSKARCAATFSFASSIRRP